MVKLLVRCSVRVMMLALAVLGVIRAQPYDDLELRNLLLPQGCPAPCFMGIRPGVTTAEEAVRILEASGWTAAIETQADSLWMVVQWNATSPAWLVGDRGLSRANMMLRNDLVQEIHLATNLTLGVIQLLMGRPTVQDVAVLRGIGEIHAIPVVTFSAVYSSLSMIVAVSNGCNGQARITVHDENVTIRYYAELKMQAAADQQFEPIWGEVLRTVC